MTQIISIHSFRGGTGKSNMVANVAALLASDGKRVGVIDTDIQSPGIHALFGLDQSTIQYTLNDYLWGQCAIEDTAYDVTDNIDPSISGKLFLIPSSIKLAAISRVINEGYNVERLNDGFVDVTQALNLDVLLIDTHPGINEETLFSIALSSILLVILRPDHQDYQGTAVTLEVARSLNVKELVLVVNKVPPQFDFIEMEKLATDTFGCEVVAVLPLADEMINLASDGIFAIQYPDHNLAYIFREIADRLSQ